jgi:hypothetical protein
MGLLLQTARLPKGFPSERLAFHFLVDEEVT